MIAPAAPIALDAILNRSWQLFRRNWIVALPPLGVVVAMLMAAAAFVIYAVVAGAFSAGFSPASEAFGATVVRWIVVPFLGLSVAAALALLASHVAVFGMADAAWRRGTATFADGIAAVRRHFGAMLVAAVGFVGVGIAAVILVLPTLGLAMIALPLFTMYVSPSVVAGGRGGFEAFGESFRLVRRCFGTSAIALLILLALQYVVSLVMYPVILPFDFMMLDNKNGHVPQISPAMFVVGGVVGVVVGVALYALYGFRAIALIGLYHAARERAAMVGASGAEGA